VANLLLVWPLLLLLLTVPMLLWLWLWLCWWLLLPPQPQS
jgi:hypothetical protein